MKAARSTNPFANLPRDGNRLAFLLDESPPLPAPPPAADDECLQPQWLEPTLSTSPPSIPEGEQAAVRSWSPPPYRGVVAEAVDIVALVVFGVIGLSVRFLRRKLES